MTTLKSIPHIVKYLQDIGIEEPILEKLEVIYSHIQKIYPCKVLDVFIDDYYQEDGTHVFEDITFFTEEGEITAIHFLKKSEYLFTPKNMIVYSITINSKDYDFEKANKNSRLTITYNVTEAVKVIGLFKATGNNCDYLMKCYQNYMKPSFKC